MPDINLWHQQLCPPFFVRAGFGGQREYGCEFKIRNGAQLADQDYAIHIGHDHIRNHQIETQLIFGNF